MIQMNINKMLDKAYEGKSFRELLDAPVDALEGVSAGDAKHLNEAFRIKTIRDLANWKHARWAQAIAVAAETEEKK
ncbi:hypothetical protein WMF18_06260 [Sorangium sp. So ce315]